MCGDSSRTTEMQSHALGQQLLLNGKIFRQTVKKQIEIRISNKREVKASSGVREWVRHTASPGSTV
jgi:hypothetical protein